MIGRVFRARLVEYAPQNATDQENALQEIMQQVVLASLSRHGLFSEAVFHGGTFLRMFHGAQRFSGDLDFLLKAPNASFHWQRYVEGVRRDCDAEGIVPEAVHRGATRATVRKVLLRTGGVGRQLRLELPFSRHPTRKLRIKLEVDTNPPAGASFETAYLTFPRPTPVTVQTLASGFALKLHALLCRPYVKGRDWYDFLWYVGHRAVPELSLLENALAQQGPWAAAPPQVTPAWLVDAVAGAIARIDWDRAREDVQRFLPLSEQDGLRHWGRDLFRYHLDRLRALLG